VGPRAGLTNSTEQSLSSEANHKKHS